MKPERPPMIQTMLTRETFIDILISHAAADDEGLAANLDDWFNSMARIFGFAPDLLVDEDPTTIEWPAWRHAFYSDEVQHRWRNLYRHEPTERSE